MAGEEHVRASGLTAAFAGIISSGLVNLICAAVSIDFVKRFWPLLTVVLIPVVAGTQYWLARRAASGKTMIRRVSATSDNLGILRVFTVTTKGAVLYREYQQNGSWGDWTDLAFGRGAAWDVAATTPGPDRAEVFVSDNAGGVWMKSLNRGQWSDWSAMDGSAHAGSVACLAALSGWPGHREVFAVGEGGKLAHRWQKDGYPWSEWFSAQQGDCVDVAACAPGPDRLECYTLDRRGDVWQRSFLKDHWARWEKRQRPEMLSSGVALAALSGSEKHQEIFVIGASGDLAHRWRWQGAEWSSWYAMPRPAMLKDVAAGTTSDGRLELLASDDAGGLWQRSYRPGLDDWTTWHRVH